MRLSYSAKEEHLNQGDESDQHQHRLCGHGQARTAREIFERDGQGGRENYEPHGPI